MKIKTLKEMYKGQYADIEVYRANGTGEYYPCRFHTDNCNVVDEEEFNDNSQVGFYELMDEEMYRNTIYANNQLEFDFEEWFGKNAQVLCIMLADIQECEDGENEESEELEYVLEDFYESCIRTGHSDMQECAHYFCKENEHMNIDFNDVLEILEKLDK